MGAAAAPDDEYIQAFDLVMRALDPGYPWPGTLGPATFAAACGGDAILRVLQTLTEDGLLTYQSLRVRGSDIEIIDAALTARGQTLLIHAA